MPKVKIIDAKDGEEVRYAPLRVTARNVRGVPCAFELIEDEQPVNVESDAEVFVVAVLPAKMFEGEI